MHSHGDLIPAASDMLESVRPGTLSSGAVLANPAFVWNNDELAGTAKEPSSVKVVILCGGLGTRLREETEFRPKPMVEVGGRPILWHIMKTYAHYGYRDFVLCLGYRGNTIKEYFLNYEAMNNDFCIHLGDKSHIEYHGSHAEQEFTVTLSDTGQECMTGGRIAKIRRYIDDDTFLMTYGDGLIDVNIDDVVNFHKSHGRIATMTAVPPISRF